MNVLNDIKVGPSLITVLINVKLKSSSDKIKVTFLLITYFNNILGNKAVLTK